MRVELGCDGCVGNGGGLDWEWVGLEWGWYRLEWAGNEMG